MNIFFVMLWNVFLGPAITVSFVAMQFLAQGLIAWIYFVMLKNTKAKIGLRPHLFEP